MSSGKWASDEAVTVQGPVADDATYDLIGVYVRPSEADIDTQQEKDLRAEGDTTLRLMIWVGRIEPTDVVARDAAADEHQREHADERGQHRRHRLRHGRRTGRGEHLPVDL